VVKGIGLRVQSAGTRVQGSRRRVVNFGRNVYGSGFRVRDLRVKSLGWVCVPAPKAVWPAPPPRPRTVSTFGVHSLGFRV
jgi:hypothetical protein